MKHGLNGYGCGSGIIGCYLQQNLTDSKNVASAEKGLETSKFLKCCNSPTLKGDQFAFALTQPRCSYPNPSRYLAISVCIEM